MRRILILMALAAMTVLWGCAPMQANIRSCKNGPNGMTCGSISTGGGGGGFQNQQPRYVAPAQNIFLVPHTQQQNIFLLPAAPQVFIQPQQQFLVPPPVLYQPQIPPPTLFRQAPMPRTGPCIGYRLVPGVGNVCQGYQWGSWKGYDMPTPSWIDYGDMFAGIEENPA